MQKKMRIDLATLDVESFEVHPAVRGAAGTVQGHSMQTMQTWDPPTCDPNHNTCQQSCDSCAWTCGDSCPVRACLDSNGAPCA